MTNHEILRKLKLAHVSTGWIMCGYNELIGHFTETDIALLADIINKLTECRAAMIENNGGVSRETNNKP